MDRFEIGGLRIVRARSFVERGQRVYMLVLRGDAPDETVNTDRLNKSFLRWKHANIPESLIGDLLDVRVETGKILARARLYVADVPQARAVWKRIRAGFRDGKPQIVGSIAGSIEPKRRSLIAQQAALVPAQPSVKTQEAMAKSLAALPALQPASKPKRINLEKEALRLLPPGIGGRRELFEHLVEQGASPERAALLLRGLIDTLV